MALLARGVDPPEPPAAGLRPAEVVAACGQED
jgi:hypothetical protein